MTSAPFYSTGQPNTMATGYQKSMFSSKDQDAQTPDDVMEKIRNWYNGGKEMHDPCPPDWNSTMPSGLETEWKDVNYVNPPYNNLAQWMEKCVEEAKKGKKVICLIPQRGDVNWWHDWVLAHADQIDFIRQGVRFKTYKRKCPFSICIVVYDGKPKKRRKLRINSIDFYEEEKAELAKKRRKTK